MHHIQSLQAITGSVKFLASAKVRRPLSTKKQTDQNGQPSLRGTWKYVLPFLLIIILRNSKEYMFSYGSKFPNVLAWPKELESFGSSSS